MGVLQQFDGNNCHPTKWTGVDCE